MNNSQQRLIAILLLLSGLCALIYQVGWLRELRLIFGGTTLASAVVLAIFMGGLGFGGLFWGRIADRYDNPLRLYAFFEIGIALLAAISPFLLTLTQNVYFSLGGSLAMGPTVALLVRIGASAVVLGVPTFLMGGTLPAVVRAVENDADLGRRTLALLYGLNTIGGVCGVILATFFLLELLGTRMTIWSGSLLNLLVGFAALFLATRIGAAQGEEASNLTPDISGNGADETGLVITSSTVLSPNFIYGAAFLVGFSFFIMEIVWNRMLTPLLGGSVYSFGLVIAVVLAGIGLGGWIYSIGNKRLSATVQTLAVTLSLEALALAVPFALGDRLAILAALLRPFGEIGFGGLLVGWTIVTTCVVFPASLVAGFQFPLLVNLLGVGRKDVGKHTGRIYAWNTFGAISGVLAGGMGLVRFLSAPGCWVAVVIMLCFLAGAFVLKSFFWQGRKVLPVFSLLGIGAALLLISAEGPTAAWRHTPVGVGNVSLTGKSSAGIRDWLNQSRRIIFWEVDGIESSIGLQAYDGLGFLINGKVDGNASRDARTQIMGPLISAILHPGPKKALVIGLGTGASAGWLADIDSVEHVDVMELEPAMLEVARRSSLANRNVLENKKVKMIIGDARESLMTSKQKYDIIFSEPSNPYRAGIASLYTEEYYHAVYDRLQPDGYFSQWVQAYDVDSETLYVITATLSTVFQEVEVWQTKLNDLIFVCSKSKKMHSMPALRDRLASEPFKSAMMAGWGVHDLEGFLAAKLSGPEFAEDIKERYVEKGLINSDDKMLVEFGFARNTGITAPPSITGFRQSFKSKDNIKPVWAEEFKEVDWSRVNKSYSVMFPEFIGELLRYGDNSQQLQNWQTVYSSFLMQDYRTILSIWQSGEWRPEYPLELAIIGEAFADASDQRAMKWAEELSEFWPVEAKIILGRYFWKRGEVEQAYTVMEAAFLEYRQNPWPHSTVMKHALDLVVEMAFNHADVGARFYELLSVPFSVYNQEDRRLFTLLTLSSTMDCEHGAEVLELIEPNVPFKKKVLEYRQRCYEETGSPHLKQARLDLEEFNETIPLPFTANLPEL